jgi:hypothetical protein
MTLSRRLGRDAMLVSSHDGDGAIKATWPWHDVAADDHDNMISGQISM